MKLSLVSIEKDGVVRVASEGNITCEDFRSAEHRNPLEGVLGQTWSNNRVLLNLEKTQYVDSSGIGWMIELAKKFRDNGGALAIHGIRPSVKQIFDLLKVSRVVPIAENEAAARELLLTGAAR